MSTYSVVPEAPKNLEAGDYVIYKPTFIDEIAKTRTKRGVNKLTTASSLREIFMLITDKYDKTVNPYHLKLNKYEGIAYDIDEDLVAVIYRVIRDNNLSLVEAAVEKLIKERPHGTYHVYYVTSDLEGVNAFIKNGLSPEKTEEKGKKPKKSENVV